MSYSAVSFFGASVPTNMVNSTALPTNATEAGIVGLGGIDLNPFTAIFKLLSHPKLKDFVGLFVIGIIAEITRRSIRHIIPVIEEWVCICTTHSPLDPSTDWLLSLWMDQPDWKDNARRFDCETEHVDGLARMMPWLQFWTRRQDKVKGKGKIWDKRSPPNPRVMPAVGQSHWLRFQGAWVRLSRGEAEDQQYRGDRSQNVTVRMFLGNMQLFKDFLAQAKAKFQEEDSDLITIKMIDTAGQGGGGWKQVALRTKRNIESVVSDDNVAQRVKDDMEEFLDSETWYNNRGIPYRRGYLLFGVPGAGKTSLIHACASALDLELYVIALATAGLNDSILLKCMTLVPPGGVVIMEDVDVALPDGNTGLKREDDDDKKESKEKDKLADKKGKPKGKGDKDGGGGITLSGLLNAIDGVAGSEGRLLFMTTNDKSKLDPALIRPGRADMSFEFFNASKSQVRKLFNRFYAINELTAARKADVVPVHSEKKSTANITEADLAELCEQYVAKIPEGLLSTAAIQGHLMLHKKYPGDAADDVEKLVAEKEKEKAEKEGEKEKEKANEEKEATEEDKEKSEEKNKEEKKKDDEVVDKKAQDLAAATILALVKRAMQEDKDSVAKQDEVNGDADKASITAVKQEKKVNGVEASLEVEVAE